MNPTSSVSQDRPKVSSDNDLGTSNQDSPVLRAAECAAFPMNDPELSVVLAAWSRLPEGIRARILGLVEGATASGMKG